MECAPQCSAGASVCASEAARRFDAVVHEFGYPPKKPNVPERLIKPEPHPNAAPTTLSSVTRREDRMSHPLPGDLSTHAGSG
jgi:hypothetical protein